MFEVGLEIREDDGKGNFVYVPRLIVIKHLFQLLNLQILLHRDKDCFKLRSNVEKCVVVTLCQITDNLTSLQVRLKLPDLNQHVT